jgi:hypothetical protein
VCYQHESAGAASARIPPLPEHFDVYQLENWRIQAIRKCSGQRTENGRYAFVEAYHWYVPFELNDMLEEKESDDCYNGHNRMIVLGACVSAETPRGQAAADARASAARLSLIRLSTRVLPATSATPPES